MLEKSMSIKGMITAIIFVTLGFTQVSLEIKNVDTDAGTLDIYMSNAAACSYCADSTYNKNSDDWTNKKTGCEDYGDTTWVSYDYTLDSDGCASVPSLDGNGGWWFDGEVGGFQFELSGITITNASSPTVLITSTGITTNPNNVGAALLIGFSITAETILAESDILLTQITFTDFDGFGICFGEDTGSAGFNAISGLDEASEALYVAANWGDCYCESASPADCAGVCGGESVLSGCDNACNSTAVVDCAGVCGGESVLSGCDNACNSTAVVDCAGVCDGTAVVDCVGECGGESVLSGCDNACNSTAVVDCVGECGGTGVVNTDGDGACCASGVIDCAEVCDGSAVDSDGDGNCDDMAILIGSNLPAEFSISQNFPNPFNPVTSITFDVAEMDEVSLIVYDLTGKEVATLVSGTYTPGTYSVEWNAVNNAGDGIVSGMYIYRYISSEKAITRKMLYLK